MELSKCKQVVHTAKDLYPFKLVSDVHSILEILKSRLPISSNIYNMAILNKDFTKQNSSFYTLHSEDEDSIDDTVWIVAAYFRYDLGYRYSISVPPSMVITEKIKDAFIKSSLFNWKSVYSFVALERRISPLIIEIGAFRFGRDITLIPTKIYMYEPSKMDTVQEFASNKRISIRELHPEEGSQFLSQNWKYSTAQTHQVIKKLIIENESVGVYLEGQLVSGVIINDSGLIGLLHTLKEHRGNGYATLAVKHLMKKIVQKGAFPCSCAEIKNYSSIAFHEKLGMTVSHFGDYIDHATPRYE